MKEEYTVAELKETLEELFELAPAKLPEKAEDAFIGLRRMLTRGEVRAAERGPSGWIVNAWAQPVLVTALLCRTVRCGTWMG